MHALSSFNVTIVAIGTTMFAISTTLGITKGAAAKLSVKQTAARHIIFTRILWIGTGSSLESNIGGLKMNKKNLAFALSSSSI